METKVDPYLFRYRTKMDIRQVMSKIVPEQRMGGSKKFLGSTMTPFNLAPENDDQALHNSSRTASNSTSNAFLREHDHHRRFIRSAALCQYQTQ